MVLYLAGIFLFLVYLFPLYVRATARGERDVFSPVLFLAGFGMMGVPYLWFIAASRDNMTPELRYSWWVHDVDAVGVQYVLMMAAAFLLTLAGIRSRAAGALAARLPVLGAERFTPARCRRALVFSLVVGFAGYLYFLQSVGGLLNLWAHMYLRASLGAGSGYLVMIYTLLLAYGAALLVYRLRFGSSPVRVAVTIAGVGAIGVVLASTGGRAPLMGLVITSFLVHHYCVRRRRSLLTPGTLAGGMVMLAFFLVAPLFRTGGAWDRYSQDPGLVADDAVTSLSQLAPQFSGFDRASVMLVYFTPDRMWMGKSYIDLFFAPIPRKFFPRKPPVDDGVYLKHIVDGHPVSPSRPSAELSRTSWPVGNLVPYMNFGLAGLIGGFFVGGLLVGIVYQYMRRSGYALMGVILYQNAVLGVFSLSVYGIVQAVMNVGLNAAFFWVFFGPRRWPRFVRAPAPAVPAGAAPAGA